MPQYSGCLKYARVLMTVVRMFEKGYWNAFHQCMEWYRLYSHCLLYTARRSRRGAILISSNPPLTCTAEPFSVPGGDPQESLCGW